MRNWFSQVLQVGLFALALGLLPAPAVSQTDPDFSDEAYGDPDRLADRISLFDGWPEAQQAKAVGNVVGQMAAMFRRYPDRVDGWLDEISSERIKAFAVIALGLAGDAERGVLFAKEGHVARHLVLTTFWYANGDSFPSSVPPSALSVAELLEWWGTLETMPQRFAWHQDVLWSAAIVLQDGKLSTRILERMDVLFPQLGIEPGPVPVMAGLKVPGSLKKIFDATKAKHGEEAAWEVLYSFLYLGSGGWSYSSNIRYPYVAAAFAAYDREHPGSAAVREVRLFK